MKAQLSESKLRVLLYTDELTGLSNLRYLREQIPPYLEKAKERNDVVALIFFDLDDFKNINDSFGHLTGDKALVHFTKIIAEKTKGKGIAIRYAGDEFLLIMPRMDKKEARQFGEDIQNHMAESPLKVGDKHIDCQCSIGISLFPIDGENWKSLFAKADEALYVAKEQGKGRLVVVPDTGKLLTPSKLNSILESPYIVGRDNLVQFLKEHLSNLGNPLVFPVIFGEEGAGKSRMIKFASDISRQKLKFTLSTKGYPFWENETYGAVFAALGSLFEEQQSLSEYVYFNLQDDYKQILKPHLPSWALKGLTDKEQLITGDNTLLFEALTQAFYLLREVGDGAVLLDDVDQIDPPSLQFFSSQFSREENGNLHFVASISSPEVTASEEKLLKLIESIPDLTSEGKIKVMQLEPLQSDHIQQLVERLFDGSSLPDETATSLAQNSRGNPFFIVEALATLLLDRKITIKDETWDLSDIKTTDMPTSLFNIIKARMSCLDKEVVEVLKLSSILGEKINPRLIAEIAGLKVQQVMNALSDAQRSLFIEESPDPEEFVFKHRIGRSVFYSLMSDTERRKLHVQAAKLERKYSVDSPERIVGKLAYHFHNAGQLEKAAEMLSSLKNQMEAVYISKGMQKILQKRILSASIAKQSTLEDEDFYKAVNIGKGFRSTIQNLRLYPKANENVKRSLNDFMQSLEPFLAKKTEVLSISVTPEKILFNGQPPPPYSDDPRLTEDLYAVMSNYGLQGVLFLQGIQQEEVIRFMEIFKRNPQEVINQWDEMLEQLEIAHILPDRKVFVAVGEHKVLLGKQNILAHEASEESEKDDGYPTQEVVKAANEHVRQMRDILDKFAKEKQELLEALKSSELDKAKMENIIRILTESNIEELVRSVQASDGLFDRANENSQEKDKTLDKDKDLKFTEKGERDISLAFEELSSQDSSTRSRAAIWLISQEPSKLAEAGLKAITSDLPYKFRRVAAGIINKAGPEATKAFLDKVGPRMPAVTLNKVIKIADTFLDNPELCSLLQEIVLKGPLDTLTATIDVLKRIPGEEADAILLDAYSRTKGATKGDIITLYAERKIKQAAPLLLDTIALCHLWEKEQDIPLQECVCRSLGVLRSKEGTEALVAAATTPKLKTLYKAKPEFIRAAATWALTQLPQSNRVDNVLNSLKRDRSHLVRKAAELSEFVREETR